MSNSFLENSSCSSSSNFSGFLSCQLRSSFTAFLEMFQLFNHIFSKHKKVSENKDNFRDDLPRTEASEEDEHGEKK